MNDQARKLLAFVIHHYGVDVIQTPKQLQALLKDHAKGQFKPEISLFMQAVTEGLVIKLLTHQYASVQSLSARAIKHLQEDCFIEKQAAHWVIDSWCIALKLTRPISIHTTPAPVAQTKPLPVAVIKSPVLPPTPVVQATPVPATQGTSSRKPLFFVLFLVVVVFLAISDKPDKTPAIASTPKAAEQGDAKAQYNFSSAETENPSSTLRDFYQAIASHDCQKAVALSEGYSLERCQKIASLKLGEVEVQTDKTVLKFSIVYRTIEQKESIAITATVSLKRVGEQWKVDFSTLKILNDKALVVRGLMYAEGQGVAKDDAQAVIWLRKSAEQGDAEAQTMLGAMYGAGLGVIKDEAQAVTWFRKAAEQGNAEAQTMLGFMYEKGQGVAQDNAQAVTWTRKAADQGDAHAQNNLGVRYAKGQGAVKDEVQAVTWYRKAAEQGDALAQNNLGGMYADGLGVIKDDAQAVTWYRKAAEQGLADAQYNLGLMYAKGQGVAKDEAQAVTWYRKAAEQGYVDAQYILGLMYADGLGVAKDETQAVTWYRKASEQGSAKAQYNLGVMYARGRGITQDDAQAVIWVRKAAEQGYAKAQFRLGFMYAAGLGVAIDEAQAVTWFRKAAEQGNEDAQRELEKIKNQAEQTTQTTESLAQEPPQAQIASQPATQTQGVWTTDWGNNVIGLVTTEACHVAELTNQGYVYAISSSIPLARLKQNADAWQIIGDRAITVSGCWFKKDANNTGLIHAKFKRKKDDKIWEDDLNLADGSWTFKRID